MILNTDKLVNKCHLLERKNVVFNDRWPLFGGKFDLNDQWPFFKELTLSTGHRKHKDHPVDK